MGLNENLSPFVTYHLTENFWCHNVKTLGLNKDAL